MLHQQVFTGELKKLSHFAYIAGWWGIDDTRTTAIFPRDGFFDAGMLNRALQELARDDWVRRTFLDIKGLAALSISYEQGCKDPFKFTVTVVGRRGLDHATLRTGYNEAAEGVRERNPEAPSRREVTLRYVATAQNKGISMKAHT